LLVSFKRLIVEKNNFERICFLEEVYINPTNIVHIAPWRPEGFIPEKIKNRPFSEIKTISGDKFVLEGSIESISEKINSGKKGLIRG